MSSLSDDVQSHETEHANGDVTTFGRVPLRDASGLNIGSNTRQADGLPALALRDDAAEDAGIDIKVLQGRDSGQTWESNARHYRKLLNTVISEASQGSSLTDEPLAPSQIGATYWTTSEKETLFRTLDRTAPTDLLTLSRSVPTKTEAEIHVYLKLLQDGVTEVRASDSTTKSLLPEEIPAAYDIDTQLEANLNAAADTLRQKVDVRDARDEQAKYASGWLIDQEYAASIAARHDAVEGGNGIEEDDTSAVAAVDRVEEALAFGLLRPEALLDLSSTIFMNPPLGSEQNWRELLPSDGSIEGPAIFRTAFEDLYSLVVSLSRRLVQASLYQAQSRLRASDASRTNWQPTADVREVDVRTAINILGTRPSWQSHWAGLPQRLGFEVYSDAQRYKDGRPGTKTGVKLTAGEVEYELGHHETIVVDKAESDQSDLALSDFDSDDLTDVDDSDHHIESIPSQSIASGSDDEKDETLGDNGQRKTAPDRKRKRALRPSTYARTEANYLEYIDQESSKEEVQRLWATVVGTPANTADPEVVISRRPTAEANETSNASHWSRRVQYSSPWETSLDKVPESAFLSMHASGEAGREKRRRLREQLSAEISRRPTTAAGQHGESELGQVEASEGAEKVDTG